MFSKFSLTAILALLLITNFTASRTVSAAVKMKHISTFPQTLSKSCRRGKAKLYDECSSQFDVFNAAAEQARKENKVVLVSFGAEWCIWCHVFDQHIHGKIRKFTYTFGGPSTPEEFYTETIFEQAKESVERQAIALNAFVAHSFVVVHIDIQYAPDGWDLLKTLGAAKHYSDGIPFIFTVNQRNKFAAKFDHDAAEKRRDPWIGNNWYRGFKRDNLLKQLKKMHNAALEKKWTSTAGTDF